MNNKKQSAAKLDTSDANLGLTKKGYAVANNSVYTKEIWNAAIEEAAKIADDADELAAKWIRKLKK